MKKIVILFFVIFCIGCSPKRYSIAVSDSVKDPKNEAVILIHGLCRSNSSMNKMQKYLSSNGYNVYNLNYISTKNSIEEISENSLNNTVKVVKQHKYSKIHFISHSLGGLIIREYLSKNSIDNLGRVVMISPPNKGSVLTDVLGNNYFYKKIGGKAGQQLYTGEKSYDKKLGPVTFETGVIAGNRTFNPFLSLIIPGQDDGKVSVENTKVQGMKDFIVVPHSHVFILSRERVLQKSLNFIEHGVFEKF